MLKKKTNTLSKTERLKSRKAIGILFHEGRSFSAGPLKGLFQITPQATTPSLQCGFTVSSKSFKKAVHRNRIKRLMRESYRLQKAPLLQIIENKNLTVSLFLIFRGNEIPEYDVIYQKMSEALSKLINMVNESNTPAA